MELRGAVVVSKPLSVRRSPGLHLLQDGGESFGHLGGAPAQFDERDVTRR